MEAPSVFYVYSALARVVLILVAVHRGTQDIVSPRILNHVDLLIRGQVTGAFQRAWESSIGSLVCFRRHEDEVYAVNNRRKWRKRSPWADVKRSSLATHKVEKNEQGKANKKEDDCRRKWKKKPSPWESIKSSLATHKVEQNEQDTANTIDESRQREWSKYREHMKEEQWRAGNEWTGRSTWFTARLPASLTKLALSISLVVCRKIRKRCKGRKKTIWPRGRRRGWRRGGRSHHMKSKVTKGKSGEMKKK